MLEAHKHEEDKVWIFSRLSVMLQALRICTDNPDHSVCHENNMVCELFLLFLCVISQDLNSISNMKTVYLSDEDVSPQGHILTTNW